MAKKYLVVMVSLAMAACSQENHDVPRPAVSSHNVQVYCDLVYRTWGKHDVMANQIVQLNAALSTSGMPSPITEAHHNYFAEFDSKSTLEHARDFNALIDSCQAAGWINNAGKSKSS